nr:MAG TPA: DNA polymerase I [Caudoviricetes sp.]
MNYLTLDFETYYDKEINLKKMTTQAYVMHPQMEVLMVSAKFNEDPVQVIDGEQIPTFFATVDWSNTAVIAHNAVFDGSILYWRYGVRPAMLIDTMSMAQALGVPTIAGSASLATCIRLLQEAGYAVPPKGTEVLDALGKRRADFTPQQWAAYREYCKNDTDITWFLFKVLRQYLTDEEMRFQDIILRCYTEPRLTVDLPTVEYELNRCRTYKSEQLAEVCKMFGTTQDNLSALLRSNDKFAEVLRSIGGVTEEEAEQGKSGTFIIPTKVSEKTGKTTWAFGKTDVAFKELCEHEDPKVQAVCQARLAAKSSIDETRCLKFLEYGSYGFLPMGYKIGGAHTNRMSGGSAGCFIGETMIVVLPEGASATEWEYRMIKDVQLTDLIWDGSDWCAHDGVVCHGVKRVYNWDGLTATKNHECFVGYDRDRTERFEWFRVNRYSLVPATPPAGGIYEAMPESNICYEDGAKAMVYDILNVGDRHCYVANGRLVHNSANMQNLPSGRREGQSDLLRRSIIAQGNSVIVNYDASQIECRVLAYIANQTDVLGVFASGGDVYSFAASKIHGIPYQEIVDGRKSSDPATAHKYSMMRQYGKTATLALGYGQGAQGFQKYALVNTGINMTMDESATTVRAWRDANGFITSFWRMCDQALATMVAGGQMYFGGADGKMFFADGNRYIFGRKVAGIRMPNGLWLNYPNLRADFTNPRRPQYFYDKCGYNGKPLETKVYSGLVAENITQALAFAVMKTQAVWIAQYYPIVMNTHDEWCIVVPREQAEVAADYMHRCMCTAPDYIQGIPLASEGGWAQSYGAVDDDWSKRPNNPDRKHIFNPMTGEVL